MNLTKLPTLAALTLIAACQSAPEPQADQAMHDDAHSQHARQEHAHGEGHQHRFEDPEQYATRWNDPARDDWQRPDLILQAMSLQPGQTVADLGAGTGYLMPHLASAVGEDGRVLALDVEPAMVSYLQKRASSLSLSQVHAQAVAPDASDLTPDSLDAIVTLNTWHHFEDRASYAATLKRALRPGAAVFVVDYKPDAPEGPPKAMRLSAETVMEELRQGGLEVTLSPLELPRHYLVIGRRAAAQ